MHIHSWTLYGTLGCHLCDQAELIIVQLQKEFSISLDKIDIATSEAMVARLGERIPVLRNNITNEEMNWPFAPERLTDWLTCEP